MRLGTSQTNSALTPHGLWMRQRTGEEAFTLAEVLAALLFMAIVIPVAVQGLRVASLAGEVADRKLQATRVAERVLNESLVTTNYSQSGQTGGTITEGTREFRWTLLTEPWDQMLTNQVPLSAAGVNQLSGGQPAVNQFSANQISMNLVTVEVQYRVQSQDYSVRLSTLLNSQQ